MINMFREIYYEVVKVFSQKKNYVVIGGHLMLMLLCYIAFKTSDSRYMNADIRKMFVNFDIFFDGMFFARIALLPTFMLIMPIFIATVAGDIVAGEIQDGTLKLYMSRPRSRIRLIVSKMIAIYAVTVLYCIYFSLICLAIGVLSFGWPAESQLIYLRGFGISNNISIMSCSEALIRYFMTMFYYSFSLMALGAIVLFLSTLFDRMTAATVSGITLYFVCYIMERLPFTEKIAPFMLSRVMNFPDLYMNVIPTGRLTANLTALSIYIMVFTLCSIISFSVKDIK